MSAVTTILRTATAPHVNLLPPEIASERRIRRVKAAFAAAVALAVLAVGGLYLNAVSEVDGAQLQLQEVQDQQATMQDQVAALAHVKQTYAQVAAAQTLVKQARDQEVRWSYYLNDLSLSLPDGVWLDTMTLARTDATGAAAATDTTAAVPVDPATGTTTATPGIGTVTFTGSAYGHNDVATWLETLSAQKGYADAYLTNSTERTAGSRTVVDFTSDVVVTDEALWRNYLNASGQ
ncbi:MAG: PilN domain-containing protein [Actinomycetes bacterium]